MENNRGFIVGEWYTCSCNSNLYQFLSVNPDDSARFISSAVINPTNNIHAMMNPGYSIRNQKNHLFQFFNPTKLAPIEVIIKYLPRDVPDLFIRLL